MKINKSSKVILICLLVLCGLIVCHRPILTSAGKLLAPMSAESAEVLILEGTEMVKNSALDTGVALLSDGRAKRMVIILHRSLKKSQIPVAQEKYPGLIVDELVRLGLKKEKVEIISVPIPGHPITLSEARFVVDRLSKEGVRSAILVSEGFHARRSFSVYNQEGQRLGLRVVPYSYFTEYKSGSLWRYAQGINDFLGESLKLFYYLLHGYVSIGALGN